MTPSSKESQEFWLDTLVIGIEMDDVNEQLTSENEVAELREQVRRLTGALEQAHQRYEELVAKQPESVRPTQLEARPNEFEALLRTKTFRWFRPLRVAYGSLRYHGTKRVPKTPSEH